MEFNENVWQITEFTGVINKTYKEMTGKEDTIHYNTVDKWFKELEVREIHYIQRVYKRKVYDEKDLKIALFIMDKRNHPSWKLNGIYDAIGQNSELTREFPEDYNNPDKPLDKQDVEKIIDNKLQGIRDELKDYLVLTIEKGREQRQKELQQMLPKPIDEDEIVRKALEAAKDYQKEYNLKYKEIRSKAIEEWNQKPESERMIKAGFFKKIENTEAKEQFVDEYIEKHLT